MIKSNISPNIKLKVLVKGRAGFPGRVTFREFPGEGSPVEVAMLGIPDILDFDAGSDDRIQYLYNPGLSRFAVMYTCTSFTFTSAKAQRDLRFMPKYSKEEGFKNTVRFFSKSKSAVLS